MAKRPERKAPADIFYNESEARKYTNNTRMIEIQQTLSERALELLCLPNDASCFVLDIGCGSGLSGESLSESGHNWIGIDISASMLDVAVEREVEGDLILADMGCGMPFRPGTFDGVISISALQWLCNADSKNQVPAKRMYCLFSSLYACVTRSARAVFQIYPENAAQIELMTHQAMKAGWTGGLVVDFPNSTKAKKMFLCLFAGGTVQSLPKGLSEKSAQGTRNSVAYSDNRSLSKSLDRFTKRRKLHKGSKEWIIEKKERRRRQGRDVRADNKYTGRRRQLGF